MEFLVPGRMIRYSQLMIRIVVLAGLLCAGVFNSASQVAPEALPQAHAHNDYEHKRPLLDALSHGFTSVEADIYLVGDTLLVGHDKEDLTPERTLTGLYLDPLLKIAGGKKSIFESGMTLTLLIDIKTDAAPTYAALKKLLTRYASMLTTFDQKEIQTNAVTIILSGNRPRGALLAEPKRLAAFDGRIPDLGKEHSVSFMPLVSDNWKSHFTWNGKGPITDPERQKLQNFVQTAHSEKRRIRFWGTPDTKEAWAELRAAGVDLINTDDLSGLATFLRQAK